MAKEEINKIDVFDKLAIKAGQNIIVDDPLIDEVIKEGKILRERCRIWKEESSYRKRERKLTAIRWFSFSFAIIIALLYGFWGINWGIQDIEANKRILTDKIMYYKQIYTDGWNDGKSNFPNSLVNSNIKEYIIRLNYSK